MTSCSPPSLSLSSSCSSFCSCGESFASSFVSSGQGSPVFSGDGLFCLFVGPSESFAASESFPASDSFSFATSAFSSSDVRDPFFRASRLRDFFLPREAEAFSFLSRCFFLSLSFDCDRSFLRLWERDLSRFLPREEDLFLLLRERDLRRSRLDADLCFLRSRERDLLLRSLDREAPRLRSREFEAPLFLSRSR